MLPYAEDLTKNEVCAKKIEQGKREGSMDATVSEAGSNPENPG